MKIPKYPSTQVPNPTTKRLLACLGIWVFGYLGTCSCYAALTATVTPGHVYTNAERPTISTLNRLGVPTVTVTGTLTNAAGSITGTMLVDTFAGSNLTWDGSSPRRLVIANGGVGTSQLASNAVLTGTVNFTTYATASGTNVWGIYDNFTSDYLLALTPGGGVEVGETGLNLYLSGPLVRMHGGLQIGPGAINQSQGGTLDVSPAAITFMTYAHTATFTNQHFWQLYKGLDSDGSPFRLLHAYGAGGYVSNEQTVVTFYTNNSVKAHGGVIHPQLATFPTNAIPSSSASGTNWAQFTYEGLLRTIATNYNLSGAFLKLVGETVGNFVP